MDYQHNGLLQLQNQVNGNHWTI